MTAQDGVRYRGDSRVEGNAASPAPGVYREDQGAESPHNDAWLEGYRYALLNPDDPGVQADLVRYQEEARERLVDDLQVQLAKAEAECKRLAKGWEQAYQQGWRQGQDQRREFLAQRDKAEAEAQAARETAAECRLEAAHLHRQLSALGADPEQLAQAVGAGEAVHLFGRTYVDRDLLVRLGADPGPVAEEARTFAGAEELASLRDGTVQVESQLLEAEGGLFVPVPAGHMLSVTVTPYDDSPAVVGVGGGAACRA